MNLLLLASEYLSADHGFQHHFHVFSTMFIFTRISWWASLLYPLLWLLRFSDWSALNWSWNVSNSDFIICRRQRRPLSLSHPCSAIANIVFRSSDSFLLPFSLNLPFSWPLPFLLSLLDKITGYSFPIMLLHSSAVIISSTVCTLISSKHLSKSRCLFIFSVSA